MDIFQKIEKDVLILTPEFKNLDILVSSQVRMFIHKLMDQEYRKILINLNNVNYLDSSGLGALVSSVKKGMEMQIDLKFCELNNDVDKVLAVTKLDKIFSIYKTEKEGVESFL